MRQRTVNPAEYAFAFSGGGLTVLLTSFFIRTYQPLNPLVLRVGQRWQTLLPKRVLAACEAEGRTRGRDAKLREAYILEAEASLTHAVKVAADIHAMPFSPELWNRFVADMYPLWDFYKKTEWFYTDILYREQVAAEIRHEFEAIKQRGRTVMNSFFLDSLSPYDLLRKAAAEFLHVPVVEVDGATIEEVSAALRGAPLPQAVHERRDTFGFVVLDGRVHELFREEVLRLDAAFRPRETGMLRGTVASVGRAQGKAAIIPLLYDNLEELNRRMDAMTPGSVLIANSTSPDLLPAIRKAVAIVADEGGLGSHAAIVSRELGIPCIVGTQNATEILKDGDLVEVDAEKGTVKILERKA